MGVEVSTGVTWDTSNVQMFLRAGSGDGVPSSGGTMVCVQFQVQDVLFYGDCRERKQVRSIT